MLRPLRLPTALSPRRESQPSSAARRLRLEKIEKVLDLILGFKLEQFAELHRRFGGRVDGLFLTDDWGTQEGTFISPALSGTSPGARQRRT